MKEGKKREFARDFLSIGSVVFYLLVLVRALIHPYRPFVDQLVVSFVVLIIISLFVKYDGYVARGLILVFFTSVFYNSNLFTGFAAFVFLGLVGSSYYLRKDRRYLLNGLVFGIIGVLVGYYGVVWV